MDDEKLTKEEEDEDKSLAAEGNKASRGGGKAGKGGKKGKKDKDN